MTLGSMSKVKSGYSQLCTIDDCSLVLYNFRQITRKKLVSMIRKYHNHKLQTNPHHFEEEVQNNSNLKDKQCKATNSLFPTKMIAKAGKGTKQCTTNIGTNTEPHNGSNNQQQQKRHTRMDMSCIANVQIMCFTSLSA